MQKGPSEKVIRVCTFDYKKIKHNFKTCVQTKIVYSNIYT